MDVSIENYVELATRTESNCFVEIKERITGIYSMRLIHACLGLSSEFGELCEDETRTASHEELGDLCWYIAIICDNCKLDFKKLYNERRDNKRELEIPIGSGVAFNIGVICDVVKRAIYYGKPFEGEKLIPAIKYLLDYVFVQADTMFVEVLYKNIEKLRIRYPEKFDMTKAYVRQIDKEQELFNQEKKTGNRFKKGDLVIPKRSIGNTLYRVSRVEGSVVFIEGTDSCYEHEQLNLVTITEY